MLRAPAVLAVLAAAKMPAAAASDDLDCSACLADNSAAFQGDTSKTAHAWCYSTHQCMPLTISVFQSCPDYSLDAGSCMCRPSVYTTCADCASLGHIGCVWVANASVVNNVTYKVAATPSQSLSTNYYWKQGRCVQGSGFSPLGLEQVVSVTLPLLSANLTQIVQPTDWFWAQCSLNGPSMAATVIAATVLLVGCCCFAGWCARRRHKRNQQLRAALLEAQTGPRAITVAVP